MLMAKPKIGNFVVTLIFNFIYSIICGLLLVIVFTAMNVYFLSQSHTLLVYAVSV